jgi:hypothetical protein
VGVLIESTNSEPFAIWRRAAGLVVPTPTLPENVPVVPVSAPVNVPVVPVNAAVESESENEPEVPATEVPEKEEPEIEEPETLTLESWLILLPKAREA